MNNLLSWNRIQKQISAWLKVVAAFYVSIGARIILPYLLLTLAIAGVGAYIVTSLVTESLQERFHNQLLDAGRVVAEMIVRQETERLATLRAVITTTGVAESVAAADRDGVAALTPQLLANSQADGMIIFTADGRHLYSWSRHSGSAETMPSGSDLASQPAVHAVLNGMVDELGDKYTLLYETADGLMIFTAGPIHLGNELVGAALVGSLTRPMVIELTELAVARVTLYDQNGQVIDTTLGLSGSDAAGLSQTPEELARITASLHQSPDRYQVMVTGNDDTAPLSRVEFLGQEYWLAFGEWRLRGESFGLFSVALPGNFIVNAAVTSRRLLSLVFALSTVGVFLIGFVVTQRIVQPLNRLVQTSLAVAQGDLQQRSGIAGQDEIGRLAASFDLMTERLAERNRELSEQAGRLEAILNSIADGVLVLNNQHDIVSFNPAASALLDDFSGAAIAAPIEALITPDDKGGQNDKEPDLRRFRIGDRILSALAAPVKTPEHEVTGTVVVLRDITREVESEELKEGFITGITHELRTPLTAIIGFSQLLLMAGAPNLQESQRQKVQRILDSANTLNQHINALIDLSQIQAQSLMLKRNRLPLSQLVTNLAQRWQEPMSTKNIAFSFEPPTEPVWVEGDEHYLSWSVENLLSNAHNYTQAGGHVSLKFWVIDHQARIDIVDNGVGISAADQAQLFNRFFRASNELTFSVRGVGLGLFVSRSIVEMHNGRIWVKSALGRGSTFSVALPIADELGA